MKRLACICTSVFLVLGAASAAGRTATPPPAPPAVSDTESPAAAAKATRQQLSTEVAAKLAFDAQHIAALNAQLAALNAQTVEMRRSEDRLLDAVHWSLATLAGVAFILIAASWWSHHRDLGRIRDDVIKALQPDLNARDTELEKALHTKLSRAIAQGDEAARVHGLLQSFEVWFNLPKDQEHVARAFEAALQAVVIARQNNQGKVLQTAISRLTLIVDAARGSHKPLPRQLVQEARVFAEDTLLAIDRTAARELITALGQIPAA